MDKTKQPGIINQGIFLKSLTFKIEEENMSNRDYKLDFDYNYMITDEGQGLFVELSVDVMKNIEKPAFDLKFVLLGIFSVEQDKENMDIKLFAENNAAAILMPYAREVISNITSRTPCPALIMPPVNVMAVLKNKIPQNAQDAKVKN